ncbi:ABC transporter ATP-binding protein [Nocardiopsis sp. NPDC055551]
MRLSDRTRLHHTTSAPTTSGPLVHLHDVSHPHLPRLDLAIHPGHHIALLNLSPPARHALTHLLTGHTHPTNGHITTHTRIHTTPTHPTLAQTITGHTHPDPHDPHLHRALATSGLAHHPHTTPTHRLPPHLAPHIHQARTLYAHTTRAHLLLIDHPTTPTPAPTPTTAHLTLTDHPALVRTADRILLFHQDRLTETGDHHQLLLRGGAYARLYALQSTRTPTPPAP